MLRCLRRMGVPWPQGLLPYLVSRQCPLPVLRWLVAEGAPAGAGEVAEAVEAAVSVRQRGWVCGRREHAGDVEAWLRGLAAQVAAMEATGRCGGGRGAEW